MNDLSAKFGMGWLPDYPDFRDNTVGNSKVSEKLLKLGQVDSINKMLTKVGVEKNWEETFPHLWIWFNGFHKLRTRVH